MDHPFMLVTHRQPDGDAIGACLGLAEALRGGGARAQVFLWGPLPRWFSDLADRLGEPAWSNDPFPVSWSPAETNTYRLSVRSATPGHALALATRFGGGGHSMSAGATIPRTTSIARLRAAVIQAGSALFEETTP